MAFVLQYVCVTKPDKAQTGHIPHTHPLKLAVSAAAVLHRMFESLYQTFL